MQQNMQCCLGQPHAGALEKIVCLGNELHIAILDPIVDHFHVVASPTSAEVGHTGTGITDCSYFLQDWFHGVVGLLGTTYQQKH